MGKVLHASGSGYFPSCIQEGVGFWSLEKAMEVFWRIRSWELNTSITYSILIDGVPTEFTVGPSSPYQFTWRYDNGGDFSPPITSEEELVCSSEVSLIVGMEQYIINEPYGFLQFTSPQKNGSLYSPGFSLYFEFEADVLGTGEYLFSNGANGQPGGQKSFSIYGSEPISIGFQTFQEDFTFVDATFSLEPTEWWSYGGTYNTSTGARL
jgi:hypothetical protein